MKSTLLAIGFLLFTLNTHAQLTNAEVYDFEVGDVFQVKYGGGFLVVTDTIIGKDYSPTLDTIFYTIDRLQYSAQTASYNESIVIQEVTNLTLPATHYTYYYTCLPATDSSFMGSCGEDIWRHHSNADETCFEGPTWYSDLYRGLGGPYYYRYDPSEPGFTTYTKTLTYYNSSQYGECGTPQIYTGIEELSQSQIQVSPNPIQSQTTVYFDDFIAKEYQLNLYSLSGKMVVSEVIPSGTKEHILNCEPLQNGMYMLYVIGDGSSWAKRIVVE